MKIRLTITLISLTLFACNGNSVSDISNKNISPIATTESRLNITERNKEFKVSYSSIYRIGCKNSNLINKLIN